VPDFLLVVSIKCPEMELLFIQRLFTLRQVFINSFRTLHKLSIELDCLVGSCTFPVYVLDFMKGIINYITALK
jgi:hypothetical protein